MPAITGQVEIKIGGNAIPHVMDFSGPSLSLETVDVTDMDSTDNWEEHISGKLSAGDITFNLHYDPDDTVHKSLHDALVGRTVDEAFIITFDDLKLFSFAGSVTGFVPSGAHNDKLVVAVTLKATGVVVDPI